MHREKPKLPPMMEVRKGVDVLTAVVVAAVTTLIAMGVVSLILFLQQAHAEPPKGVDLNSPLSQWYRSLRQPGTGIGCCSEADCRPRDAHINGDHWEALVDDKWLRVPDEKILHNVPNLEGRAVLCYLPSIGILCFVPPAEI